MLGWPRPSADPHRQVWKGFLELLGQRDWLGKQGEDLYLMNTCYGQGRVAHLCVDPICMFPWGEWTATRSTFFLSF